MAANAGETKVKLWEGICYPENMRDDWQDEIDDILQVPFAYAVHDIDHDLFQPVINAFHDSVSFNGSFRVYE